MEKIQLILVKILLEAALKRLIDDTDNEAHRAADALRLIEEAVKALKEGRPS